MNILREISIKTELVISSIIFILSIIEIAFLIETLQFTPKSTIWEKMENGKYCPLFIYFKYFPLLSAFQR